MYPFWFRVSTARVDSSKILPKGNHASSKNLTVSNTPLNQYERCAHGANDEGQESAYQ